VLPDIPTVAEFVPGYEFSFWTGIGAPKNTPAAIVDKLNTEINAALADPNMKARLAELGATALPGSLADFGINSITGDDNIRWRDRRRCECRLKSAAGGAAMEEITDWLEKLGMSEYTQSFAEHRIDVSVLRHLTDQDLKDIGIPLGHRRKILAAIGELTGTAPATPKFAGTEPGADAAERLYTDCSEYYEAEAVALGETMGERVEAKAFARSVTNEFENYVKLNKRVPPEVVGVVQQIEDYAKLADTVASHLALKIPDRQAIPGDHVGHRAAREGARPDRQRDFGAAGREAHPHARQAADGEDPTRTNSPAISA
jgi:hypothetical protein